MKKDYANRLWQFAQDKGVIRASDVTRLGIPSIYLKRLCDKGQLQRVSRGVYVAAGSDVTEHHHLSQVARRVPRGVFCLLTALQFHNIGTQSPHQVWIALDVKARCPRLKYPQLKVVRFSGQALTAGVEKHRVEGVTIRVYSAAKTVADCFKYRNKIGLDVALEALREYRRLKLGSMDDLWSFAKICRVSNVMRPYMESLP
ncbi:MAG: type IV toxin-antitoxin system AbiEi family antitoxin domain-containing protein [PVC group bacterium]